MSIGTRMCLSLAAALTMIAAPLAAGPITQVVVFGDSLSDTGNVFALTGYPPAPHWNGRQSDGPVAVEYLASNLGVPLVNLAFNGATTGAGNIDDGGTVAARVLLPGMTAAFNDALASHVLPIDPGALYVVWGGPNDLALLTNPADAPAVIGTAITNLVTIAASLQALGVTNIIVPGMPDLSLTPRGLAMEQAQPGMGMLLHALTMSFNGALTANLPAGATFFDTNAVFLSMISNPGLYGLTNVTEPCYNGSEVCAHPEQYLFWEGIHPSTVTHSVMGSALTAAAVPEPHTWSMALVGACLIAAASKRIRKR